MYMTNLLSLVTLTHYNDRDNFILLFSQMSNTGLFSPIPIPIQYWGLNQQYQYKTNTNTKPIPIQYQPWGRWVKFSDF